MNRSSRIIALAGLVIVIVLGIVTYHPKTPTTKITSMAQLQKANSQYRGGRYVFTYSTDFAKLTTAQLVAFRSDVTMTVYLDKNANQDVDPADGAPVSAFVISGPLMHTIITSQVAAQAESRLNGSQASPGTTPAEALRSFTHDWTVRGDSFTVQTLDGGRYLIAVDATGAALASLNVGSTDIASLQSAVTAAGGTLNR